MKHIKIYIREIDDTHVVFNTLEAYQQALEIYKKAELQFTALWLPLICIEISNINIWVYNAIQIQKATRETAKLQAALRRII